MKLTTQSGRIIVTKRRQEKHGMTNTPEAKAHQNIVQRCTNPKNPDFKNYGARLKPCIDVRIRRSVKAFVKHVGPRPGPGYSIHRIDNDKGYVLGNFRWATAKEQADNRSTTRYIEYGGVRCSVSDWARSLGLHPDILHVRLRRGWTIERVIAEVKAKQDAARNVIPMPCRAEPCPDKQAA